MKTSINPKLVAERSAGFGLVEVLVAMAIGMIGILAIMQAFAVNERYKENTVGTSGAQTNGSISIFTIERDIRMSGYGISNTASLGCGALFYHYNGAYSAPPGGGVGAALPPIILAPVVIDQGAGTAPDTITTLSSGNPYRTVPAIVRGDVAASSTDITVDNGTGFKIGDLVVAVQPAASCSLMQITGVQGAIENMQRLPSSLYNATGGANNMPPIFTGAYLFSLGQPQLRRYTIASNNLRVEDWDMVRSAAAPSVIVDEIVDLQAEYGLDDGSNSGAAGDHTIDGYTTTTPASAAAWEQLQAIRFAVLSRGGYERPDASGTCTATTVVPTWAGSQLSPLNIPGGVPSCYRYRVFETTVPVRNVIWRDDRS